MFALHAVNYVSYLWYMDLVKKYLTPLNVNRYQLTVTDFWKVNGVKR